jgi:hypothetical protein
MVCRTARGIGSTHRVVVTVGQGAGSLTEVVSYDIALIERASSSLSNLPHTGGGPVMIRTLEGLFADWTAKGRLGGSSCESSVWLSETAVSCMAPRGLGGSLKIVLTAGMKASTSAMSASYDSPRPFGTQPLSPANLRPTGGIGITASGVSFGLWDASPKARIGGSACERTGWVSESSMFCKASRGIGKSLSAAVSVAVAMGTALHAATYDSPITSGVFPANSPAYGGRVSSVFGRNFASDDYSASSRVGGSACQLTEWASDSSVRCKTAGGGGGSRSMTLTVGQQVGSLTSAISYDSPSVSRASHGNIPGGGGGQGMQVQLSGASLGFRV